MALRRLLQVFSTMMVKTYDFDWLRDMFTDQVLTRMTDLASAKGVVVSVGNTLEVYADGTDIKIKTGAAWIAGERVEVESVETIAAGADDTYYILIQHANEADSDAHATRLDDVGDPHTVWYRDGYTLIKTTNGAEAEDPTKLLLAQAVVSSGVVTITDMRTYVSLGLPLPAASVVTAWLANQAVTNAKIGNKAVTSGKIDDNGVAEVNLAPGTGQQTLIQDIQTETAAGDKVNPATAKIDYACSTGGVYEYKIFGRVLREAQAGPVRRIKLVADVETSGTGTATIHLVAWPNGTEPGSYDPDSPSYDGLVDSADSEAPGTETIDLVIDVSALDDTDPRITYGVVMVNNTSGTAHLQHVSLVAIR